MSYSFTGRLLGAEKRFEFSKKNFPENAVLEFDYYCVSIKKIT